MSGRWAVVAARGGTGVSTLCVNLARAFVLGGERTLLCDAAPTAPSLDLLTGMAERVVYTLTDVGRGVSARDAALLLSQGDLRRSKKDAEPPPLWLLPLSAGERVERALLGTSLSLAMRDLRPRAALVDTEWEMLPAVAPTVDGCILALTADEVSLRAAEALVRRASEDGIPFCGFVLSRAVLSRAAALAMPALIDLVDRIGLPLLGILPESDVIAPPVSQSVAVGQRRYTGCDYVRAVSNIRDRLSGRMTPLLSGIRPDGISRYDYLTHA